jgi:hypothetical protein
MSFVDLMASALGAVLLLVLLLAVAERQDAETAADDAVRIDVTVTGGDRAGAVGCRVWWFLEPPGFQGQELVPIETRTGGPYLARLTGPGLVGHAWVADEPAAGWSSLWMTRARTGDWRVVLRVRGEPAVPGGPGAGPAPGPPSGPVVARVVVRVGRKKPEEFSVPVELRAGEVVPVLFPGQVDGLRVTVPGAGGRVQ